MFRQNTVSGVSNREKTQEENTVIPISRDRTSEPYANDFEIAWSTFPRKQSKRAAYKAYVARRRSGLDAATLLDATRHYAASCCNREQQFIMHGSTFYGPNDRWRDYLDAPRIEPATAVASRPVNNGADDWVFPYQPEGD